MVHKVRPSSTVYGRCNDACERRAGSLGAAATLVGPYALLLALLQLAKIASGQEMLVAPNPPWVAPAQEMLVAPNPPWAAAVAVSDALVQVPAQFAVAPPAFPIAPPRMELDEDTYLCDFRLDDHLMSVYYNGIDIRYSAVSAHKDGSHQLDLQLVPGAFLVITGFDEDGNMGDTGGFWADCESVPAHNLASSWQSVCSTEALPQDVLLGQGQGWHPATLHSAPQGDELCKAGMLGDLGTKYCAFRMVPLPEGDNRGGEALAEHEIAPHTHGGDAEPNKEEFEIGLRRKFRRHEVGMAMMLLGSVFLIMTMFYMVNWNDDDIRRYSWQIISSTVSIFVGVLAFRGIEEFFLKDIRDHHHITSLLLHYVLFFVLFIMLQTLIAYTSGATCEADTPDLQKEVWIYADSLSCSFGKEAQVQEMLSDVGKKGVAHLDGVELFVRKTRRVFELREQHVKANTTIIAHMTGFAAINMGGCLMHLPSFAGSWYMAAVSVVLNQILLYMLFKLSHVWRRFSSTLDGVEDDRDKLYLEEVEDSENDIYGLSTSFLFVQVIRFMMTGSLPTTSGRDAEVGMHLLAPHHHSLVDHYEDGRRLMGIQEEQAHSSFQIVCLFVAGIISAILVAVVLPLYEDSTVSRHEFLQRPLLLFQTQVGMTSAWCVLWASHWWAAAISCFEYIGGVHSMAGKVALASALSALSVLIIGCLDKIQDGMAKTSSHSFGEASTSKFLSTAITSLSILVGFSWEHCFDGGVSAIASLTPQPHATKLILAVAVVLVITPAWRMYMLTKEMVYNSLHEEIRGATSKRTGSGGGHVPMKRVNSESVRMAQCAD